MTSQSLVSALLVLLLTAAPSAAMDGGGGAPLEPPGDVAPSMSEETGTGVGSASFRGAATADAALAGAAAGGGGAAAGGGGAGSLTVGLYNMAWEVQQGVVKDTDVANRPDGEPVNRPIHTTGDFVLDFCGADGLFKGPTDMGTAPNCFENLLEGMAALATSSDIAFFQEVVSQSVHVDPVKYTDPLKMIVGKDGKETRNVQTGKAVPAWDTFEANRAWGKTSAKLQSLEAEIGFHHHEPSPCTGPARFGKPNANTGLVTTWKTGTFPTKRKAVGGLFTEDDCRPWSLLELEDTDGKLHIVVNIHLGERMRTADKFGLCATNYERETTDGVGEEAICRDAAFVNEVTKKPPEYSLSVTSLGSPLTLSIRNGLTGKDFAKYGAGGRCGRAKCTPEEYLTTAMLEDVFKKAYPPAGKLPDDVHAVIVGGDFNGSGMQNKGREPEFAGMYFTAETMGGAELRVEEKIWKNVPKTCCVDMFNGTNELKCMNVKKEAKTIANMCATHKDETACKAATSDVGVNFGAKGVCTWNSESKCVETCKSIEFTTGSDVETFKADCTAKPHDWCITSNYFPSWRNLGTTIQEYLKPDGNGVFGGVPAKVKNGFRHGDFVLAGGHYEVSKGEIAKYYRDFVTSHDEGDLGKLLQSDHFPLVYTLVPKAPALASDERNAVLP